MSDAETSRLVLEVLGQIAPEAALGDVDRHLPLRDQFDLDSMDYLNFVIGLHERTGIEIPERDYTQFATLDGCVAYLLRAGYS